MSMIKVGIIGGSGLDSLDIFKNPQLLELDTKWGKPSSLLTEGRVGEIEVVVLARHGKEHTIPPTQVNYRANLEALKQVGCTHVLATTAVGSLREEIERGDLIIIDQFIDFTKQRKMTVHEAFLPHTPAHAAMSEPFDAHLRELLIKAARARGYKLHEKGTVVTIEGPRFSTRAESNMFRTWGADIINMSIATEAVLANELEIPYAAIAMSTDYDCWKIEEEPVTWDSIAEVFGANALKVTSLLLDVVGMLDLEK